MVAVALHRHDLCFAKLPTHRGSHVALGSQPLWTAFSAVQTRLPAQLMWECSEPTFGWMAHPGHSNLARHQATSYLKLARATVDTEPRHARCWTTTNLPWSFSAAKFHHPRHCSQWIPWRHAAWHPGRLFFTLSAAVTRQFHTISRCESLCWRVVVFAREFVDTISVFGVTPANHRGVANQRPGKVGQCPYMET